MIPELDVIVTSAGDCCVMFWGAYTHALRGRISCRATQVGRPVGREALTMQLRLAYVPRRKTLLTAEAGTGDVLMWDPETTKQVGLCSPLARSLAR